MSVLLCVCVYIYDCEFVVLGVQLFHFCLRLVGVPVDGVPQNNTVSVNLIVTAVFGSLSIVGIVFSVVCLLFNLIFRNKP